MYDQLCDIAKIEKYYHHVRLTSKHRRKIVNFENFYMMNIAQIYFVLKNRQYKHSAYNVFLIKEPKYRIIMSEIISDKIVNHLLSEEILLPILEPKLIEMNVATRKDKGLKKGLYYVKKYINSLKFKCDHFYILKCDISKYFYKIDHEVLLEKLACYIKDKEILDMIKDIIETTNSEETNKRIRALISKEEKRIKEKNLSDQEYRLSELHRIPFYDKGKGIPIGNMTSQIFAVFYLNDLDHFIKEKLKIKYYVRYMDDFILFHPDKEYLKYCLKEIEKELAKVKLELNRKTQIISMKQGFSFIGYRFILKGKKLIVLLNPQTKRRICKKMKYIENHPELPFAYRQSAMASYKGYFLNAHCGAFLYRHGWYQKKKKK